MNDSETVLLHREELTELTADVAGIIYDIFFTQCYVEINKKRSEEEQQKSLDINDIDEVLSRTDELLKHFTFQKESNKILDMYQKILKENKGLLMTEQNIESIIRLVIANLDSPIDIGPCIVHFNSFIKEDTDEMKETLDSLIGLFDESYINHDMKNFLLLCSEAFPLLTRYVINELEICDILKTLGDINGVKVFYLGIDGKPSPPLGYSSEFSYPIIPYRIVGFIDNKGDVVSSPDENNICVTCLIKDMNIYKFQDTEESIDILVTVTVDNTILLYKGIRLSFEDYLKIYMSKEIPEFICIILRLVS